MSSAASQTAPRIGVLAVQGDFDAHARALRNAGAEPVLVKHADQVRQVSGLVLPGGESTTVLKFLTQRGFLESIADAAKAGTPIFGTCAGAILLAREVQNPPQISLGLIDMTVRRNAYGRQLSSFIARERQPALADEPVEMVFIRAPIIESVGAGVDVLASCRNSPVLVRQGRHMAATFHPELSVDLRVHRLFLELVSACRRV